MRKILVLFALAVAAIGIQAQSCPVRIARGSVVAENDLADTVHVTFKNTSSVAIRAISFDVYKTDQFGDTYEPYKTAMAYEHHVDPGQSLSGKWDDVLFDTLWERNDKHSRPGRFIVGVYRIAFADGRVLESHELGGCFVGF